MIKNRWLLASKAVNKDGDTFYYPLQIFDDLDSAIRFVNKQIAYVYEQEWYIFEISFKPLCCRFLDGKVFIQ